MDLYMWPDNEVKLLLNGTAHLGTKFLFVVWFVAYHSSQDFLFMLTQSIFLATVTYALLVELNWSLYIRLTSESVSCVVLFPVHGCNLFVIKMYFAQYVNHIRTINLNMKIGQSMKTGIVFFFFSHSCKKHGNYENHEKKYILLHSKI